MSAKILGWLGLLLGSYALLGFLYGPLQLLGNSGLVFCGERSSKIATCFAIIIALSQLFRGGLLRITPKSWLCAAAASFFFVLSSDVISRSFGFYNNGTLARCDIFVVGAILSAILALRKRCEGSQTTRCILLLLFLQTALTYSFCQFADGRLLWSDDHPTFLYRLELLRENFPFIPFYNPAWNLGYQAREFFATGVLNVFFLSFPVLYSLRDIQGPEDAVFYTYLIPYLFIWIVPWSIFAATKILRHSTSVASIAGILALAPSTLIFEWALKYGTLAFVLSAGLFPLTFALAFRLALDEKPPRMVHVLALLLTASLCLMWTLTSLALIPLLIFSLLHPRQLLATQRRTKIVLFALLFAVLNGPWVLTFLRESQVVDFVSKNTLPGSESHATNQVSPANGTTAPLFQSVKDGYTLVIGRGLVRFREGISKANPFVLFLGLGGLALITDRRLRVAFLATAIALIFAAVVGDPFKPQLELRRVLLHLSFLLCIPASHAAQRILLGDDLVTQTAKRSLRALMFATRLVILGAIGITPLTASAAYLNRSSDRFSFAPPIVGNLTHAISKHGGNGVTFFAGFILHDLGATSSTAQNGGHVAPLATFTQKNLYASDFMHRKWSSIDPIPKAYRDRGPTGIEEFLDLVNTTAVVTFTRPWADYCRGQSRYEQVFHEGNFSLFKRSGGPNSFFYRGRGEFRRDGRELLLKPLEQDVVIRFRYLPGITTSHPRQVELYPVHVFDEDQGGSKSSSVEFIGLKISKEFIESGEELHIGYFAEGEL